MTKPPATKVHVDAAMLPGGWAHSVVIEIGPGGDIASVRPGAAADGCRHVAGAAVPGMPNLHSHAFQRAMAGLAEVAAPPSSPGSQGSNADSFWTWRRVMYGFVGRLRPDDVWAIAAHLYVEMLKAGYTAVGEFHYLHHGPDGTPYAARTELSDRIIAAAIETGIAITHLPVLYACGDFGGAPPDEGQRRFINDADGFLDLVGELKKRHADHAGVTIGMAPHSLRAVTPEMLSRVVTGFTAMDAPGTKAAPIHIHIAEQQKEVADCTAVLGQPPVAWLLDQGMVDKRWCLVHATHMTGSETAALAATGAVAGLCPTTEANLGDGLFPAAEFLAHQGSFGIGSDSNISVNVAEELRWLEYGQRLAHGKRNVLAAGAGASTGATLYRGALAGGARALGRPMGAIETGRRADMVFLDTDNAALAGKAGDAIIDGWIFAASENPVRHVMVGGRMVIEDGRHAAEQAIGAGYRRAVKRLVEEGAP